MDHRRTIQGKRGWDRIRSTSIVDHRRTIQGKRGWDRIRSTGIKNHGRCRDQNSGMTCGDHDGARGTTGVSHRA